MELIDEEQSKIKYCSLKTKLTKLSNLLFQIPPSLPKAKSDHEYKHNTMEHKRPCKKAQRHQKNKSKPQPNHCMLP
jgi:hypothetical protein